MLNKLFTVTKRYVKPFNCVQINELWLIWKYYLQTVVYWPPTPPNMPFQRRRKCISHWRGRAWLTIWDRVKIPRYSHRLIHSLMVKVVNTARFWHFDDSMPAIREADLWQTGYTNTILVQGLDGEILRSFIAKSADIPASNLHLFSLYKNCGGLLIYHRSLYNIAVYITHWRRYFGIWLREGSQVLPGETLCLPQIFHRRIDRATRGRRLPEQTPPRFSPEPLYPGCSPNTAGCLTNPLWVTLPGTEVPNGIALALPVATALPRWGGVGL